MVHMETPPPQKFLKLEEEDLIIPVNEGTSILDLPPEILIHILSFLDLKTLFLSVVLVCKRWRDAVMDDALWTSVKHLKLERRKIPLPLRNLIQQCSNLTHLTLLARDCWPKRLMNATVFEAISQCHKLKFLSIRHFLIHPDCAVPLLRCLASLDSLNTFDLSYCKLVDVVGDVLSKALTKAKGLKSLQLVGLSSLSSNSSKTLTRVIQNCFPLQHLDLSSCNAHFDEEGLRDALMPHLHSLQSLNLTGNTLSEGNFAHIEHCRGLEDLKVDCSSLVDDSLIRLRDLPLKELELHCGFGFSHEGFKEFFLVGNLSLLRSLNVHGCSKLKDEGLFLVARRCPQLRELRAGMCPKLTDEGVGEVVRRCSHLVVLVLRGLTGLNGEFLKGVRDYQKTLKFIDLAYCDNVRVKAMKTFLQEGSPSFKVQMVPQYMVPYSGSSIDAYRCFVDVETVADPKFESVLLISKEMSAALFCAMNRPVE